jgi:hypothetical protein
MLNIVNIYFYRAANIPPKFTEKPFESNKLLATKKLVATKTAAL